MNFRSVIFSLIILIIVPVLGVLVLDGKQG